MPVSRGIRREAKKQKPPTIRAADFPLEILLREFPPHLSQVRLKTTVRSRRRLVGRWKPTSPDAVYILRLMGGKVKPKANNYNHLERHALPLLLKTWAEEERTHGGVIFVDEKTISPADIGGLVWVLTRLAKETGKWDWTNRAYFLCRLRQLPGWDCERQTVSTRPGLPLFPGLHLSARRAE